MPVGRDQRAQRLVKVTRIREPKFEEEELVW
jgi:hypothetical protein